MPSLTKEGYYMEKPRGIKANISPWEVTRPKTIKACILLGFWPWNLPNGYIHHYTAFPHNVLVLGLIDFPQSFGKDKRSWTKKILRNNCFHCFSSK